MIPWGYVFIPFAIILALVGSLGYCNGRLKEIDARGQR